jgi:hypothetical protein
MLDRNNLNLGKLVCERNKGKQIALGGKRITYASFTITPLPNAWLALHAYNGCDPVWHAEWELTIPNYGCSCRKDYAEYKAENPPDFSSPTAYWLWGYNLHNWVNRKLGKTELTVEEARAIWRRQDGTEQGEGMGGSTLQQVSRDSESNVSEATSEGASRSV